MKLCFWAWYGFLPRRQFESQIKNDSLGSYIFICQLSSLLQSRRILSFKGPSKYLRTGIPHFKLSPYTNVHQNNFKHLSVVLISRCFHAYIIYQKFRQKDFWRKNFRTTITNFGRKKIRLKKMWTAFYFCYFLNELSSLINR